MCSGKFRSCNRCYDMATWMSISVLAEESISMGGQPIAIPDFTSGKWMNRK